MIFRATDQWFMIIDHDGHRVRALDQIERAVRWDPSGSRNRIRDAVGGRPDWCLSRQRVWGVGIPALYCEPCGKAVLDAGVMARAAEVVRGHGSDAWYERDAAEFVPKGFACPRCGGSGPFRKETDILDVWFDSGCTHRAAPAGHADLARAFERAREPGGHVAYFEGPDQHRGWFNSSLMVSIGIDGRAPYTDVLTHGWVLDQQGRAMHKSLGNVISPEDVVKRYGAEIVRWWALATDWRSDVRVGDEILQRVAEAYRKVRNTFRFLLGNLADFDPGDALPTGRLTAVDRAFVDHLDARVARLGRDWQQLVFHRVLDSALDLCTVDLSAVFLDVAKDRLYTLAPDDPARRSAQTVLWRAVHDLAIALSPALAFTTEEVWQHHPGLTAEFESVHLARFPGDPAAAVSGEPESQRDAAESDWLFLRGVRDAVNAALEPLRASKELAGTAEAEVTLQVPPAVAERLAPYADELAGFLIVAAARLVKGTADQGIQVRVTRTAWKRCERCWMHREDVDSGGLCGRCTRALAATGRAAG